jgi:hypothetical protein
MEINKKVETIIKHMVDEITVASNKDSKEQIDLYKDHEIGKAKFSWYHKLNENEKELVSKFMDNLRLDTVYQMLHLLSHKEGDGNTPAELYRYKLTVDEEEIGEDLHVYFDTVLNINYPILFRRFVHGEMD